MIFIVSSPKPRSVRELEDEKISQPSRCASLNHNIYIAPHPTPTLTSALCAHNVYSHTLGSDFHYETYISIGPYHTLAVAELQSTALISYM